MQLRFVVYPLGFHTSQVVQDFSHQQYLGEDELVDLICFFNRLLHQQGVSVVISVTSFLILSRSDPFLKEDRHLKEIVELG